MDPDLSHIAISMIGRLDASCEGALAPLRGARGAALLALVALTPGRSIRRADAAALIWPEAPGQRGRDALRQALRSLSDALAAIGFDGLDADRDRIAIPPARLVRDVDPILRSARSGFAHPALLAGEDPFARLCGLESSAHGAFADHVAGAAAAMRLETARGLRAALAADPPPQEARDLAAGLLALERCDEAAARRLMEAEAALGAPDRALAAYDALWRALDERHGEEPNEQTNRLLRTIRAAAAGRQPDAGAAVPSAGWQPTGAARVSLVLNHGRVERVIAAVETSSTDGAAIADAARRLAAEAAAPRGVAFEAAERRERIDARAPEALLRAAALAAGAPRDAPGWAAEADAAALAPALDLRPPEPLEAAAARAAAERAVDADPLDARARRALGWAALLQRDFDAAAAAFALSAELDPDAADGLTEAALGLSLAGRPAAAAGLGRAAAAGHGPRSALAGMLALALGAERPPEPETAEPPLARAWRAAALARSGGAAEAAALAAGLAHRPGWAEAAARALPDRDEARAATRASGLAAAAEALARLGGG